MKPIQWNKPAVQFVFELEDDSIPGSETPGSGNADEVRIPKWQWQYKIQGDKIIDDGDTLGADKKYEDITKCLSNLADYIKAVSENSMSPVSLEQVLNWNPEVKIGRAHV